MNVKKIMPVFLAVLIVFPAMTRTEWLIYLRNIATHWQWYVLRPAYCDKIILTVIRMRRRHRRRAGQAGPQGGGAGGGAVPEPAPRAGADPQFLASDFFDARDAVQVKYEMVRKVRAGGVPVTEAAAAFGYSRPAYYTAAAALESSGLEGLVPARPGPRGAHKLTEEICAWAEEQLAADPGLRPAQLPDLIEEAFGVRVHPLFGRAGAGPPPGAALQKPRKVPAREMRKEDDPSPSLLPSPGHAAAEPGARPDARPGHRPRRRAGRPLRGTAPMLPCTHAPRRSRSASACSPARASPPEQRTLAVWPSRSRRRPGGCPAPPRPSPPGSRHQWPPS